ncbi:MAG TPA: hypothetical protein VNM91_05310 [Dehalococcoidia bacterium]|nr:hypothetical protein [Dehalococcoidia bacterium]
MSIQALLRALTLSALPAAALVAAGCGGGGDDEPTPAPTTGVTAGPTLPGPVTPVGDIRSVDLQSLEEVQARLSDSGGSVSQEDVIYADVTADGIDDAVVPVASEGTLGQLGFMVLTPTADGAAVILDIFPSSSYPGMAVDVVGDKVVMTQPVPGPDDPECCPGFLRRTTWAWNGAALAIESSETVENPDAIGDKLTPQS